MPGRHPTSALPGADEYKLRPLAVALTDPDVFTDGKAQRRSVRNDVGDRRHGPTHAIEFPDTTDIGPN